jgi:acetyl esterase
MRAATDLHPAIATLLERARAAGIPAISAGSPEQARRIFAASVPALGPGPAVREMRGISIPTRAGHLPAMLLLPEGKPRGLCLYLHGGGWVIGSPLVSEALARALTARSGFALLLPDYRKAPEHAFPAGLEDCEDALLFAAANRAALMEWDGGLVIAGDSAGGNLATIVANRLRGRVPLAGQALIYPVAGADFDTRSYHRYGTGLPLGREDMRWFFRHYAPPALWNDPAIAPLAIADLTGMPQATVTLAALDVLHDEGIAYADRLRQAGKLTALRVYPRVTHGFLRLFNLVDTADAAVTDIALDLKRFIGEDA